jgi:peptidoglycan/LPS O-acetylase OafA/YrhL
VLSHPWLVYLGRRSYALYIWHYPISKWTQDLSMGEQLLLGVPLSLAVAELSYRLVERPAMRMKGRFSRPSGDTLASQTLVRPAA